MTRKHPLRAAGVAGLLLLAEPARAEPPGNWSVAVERLFGASRAWSRGTNRGGTDANQTSVSLFTQSVDSFGYAAPRAAVDYILDVGVSFGGSLGFGEYRADYEYDDYPFNAGLLAPRVGFLMRPAPSVAVWLRAGITLVTDGEGKASAFTLEAPVVLLVPEHVVGLTLTPYFEYGFGTAIPFLEDYSVYERVSELGLSIGGNAFF